MAFAAIAALVAVARMATAQTVGPAPAAFDPIARAAAEAHALVARIQNNRQVARDALALARSRKLRGEIRCADESLSRADVALRRAHEHAANVAAATANHDVAAVRAELARVRMWAAASHEAEVLAISCSSPAVLRPGDRTVVTVRVAPVARANGAL